mgnify:CR=1 FL=1
MENEKNIFFIIAVAFCIVFSGNIYNSVKSYKYRRFCDEYREQLITTEEANRNLADRIGRITEITGRIKETANANITDARGIIETVEELRTEIKELEDCCGSFNQLEYYQYWDNEFCISQ